MIDIRSNQLKKLNSTYAFLPQGNLLALIKLKLTDWQLIEDTNSAEIVSDPYRRTQQDKEMDKAHFLLDLKTRTLIRIPRT